MQLMQTLLVKGMHCKSCVAIVTEILEEVGASNIVVTLNEKTQIGKVTFDYSGDKKVLIHAIEKEGYTI